MPQESTNPTEQTTGRRRRARPAAKRIVWKAGAAHSNLFSDSDGRTVYFVQPWLDSPATELRQDDDSLPLRHFKDPHDAQEYANEFLWIGEAR